MSASATQGGYNQQFMSVTKTWTYT